MKMQNKHLTNTKLARKLLLVIVSVAIVCLVGCSLFACSDKESAPSDFVPHEQEETPTTPHDTPDDEESQPSEAEILQAQIANIIEEINSANKSNAKTVVSVSFGGKVLSSKDFEYTRQQDGGVVKTTTVSLDMANAKNPYKTESEEKRYSKSDFDKLFPIYDLSFATGLANVQFSDHNGAKTLYFTLSKDQATLMLNLSKDEISNIATDLEIAAYLEDLKISVGIKYVTVSGNTVEIVTTYKAD